MREAPPDRAPGKMKRLFKTLLFPFLFMVNPKLYFPVDDEEKKDEKAGRGQAGE
jgi:hypothetical protein